MALTQQQSQQLYGTDYYTGWQETEAKADATAKGIGSSGGDVSFESRMDQLFKEIQNGNAEAENELMEIAKGDYDLVAKWIEKAYTNATGTDDVARQEFIKKVSSDLENKIGTFAYDYETGTYRSNEDLGITKENLNYNKNTALERLAQDDATYKKQYEKQALQERATQGETLNQRGLLTGTREQTQGVGSIDVNNLEGDIQDRFDALSRATERENENINRSYTTGMAEAELTNKRNVEDLTTVARRGISGATDTRNSGLEQAMARRKAEELRIKQERKRADDQAKLLAQQQAGREAYGYYGS